MMANPIVCAIADNYDAALLYSQEGKEGVARQYLEKANSIHEWLEDITVSGRDACDLSLEEIVEEGRARLKIYADYGIPLLLNGDFSNIDFSEIN